MPPAKSYDEDAGDTYMDGDVDDEEIEEPEEWQEEPETSSTNGNAVQESSVKDHQEEFKVLGQQDFHKLPKINVTSSWVKNATVFPAELSSEHLAELSTVSGIPKKLFKKVQDEIKSWFPVQKAVIPMLLKDIIRPPIMRPRDITISAPTGSGKTLCYVLPALTLVGENPIGKLCVLILAPAQTLVTQIEKECQRFNAYDAQIVALSGADEFDKEFRKLSLNAKKGCDIIIATPSRFMEHITKPNSSIQLDFIQLLVIDEADQMGLKVRMEWLEIIEKRSNGLTRATNLEDILNSRDAPRKLLLSATLSKDIEELHMWNLHRPCLFRATAKESSKIDFDKHDHVAGILALPNSIDHELICVEKSFHPLVIFNKIAANNWQRILVFVNEKSSAERLNQLLTIMAKDSFQVANVTSNLFGRRREKTLKKFKTGLARVLICSDVLARGVDIPDVDCVVNYDLPANDRLFVHRAGRTGRAGNSGFLVSIADKQKNRLFSNMLKKMSLWNNITESAISEEDLQPYMEKYKEALQKLKKQFGTNGNGSNNKVSGFQYKRKRKWIPDLKEKREAEKMAKRGLWKKKEKKDF